MGIHRFNTTFIFRPHKIINSLKLEQGVNEERIEFNLSKHTILIILLILISGNMFINGLIEFCSSGFNFMLDDETLPRSQYSNSVFVALAKILIGYILFSNHVKVVDFIEKLTREKNEEEKCYKDRKIFLLFKF